MTTAIVVVDHPKDWRPEFPSLTVVPVKDYLSQTQYMKARRYRVINLCRSYRYLSNGYFCSMLAEPRQHKVIPSITTLTQLSRKSIYALEAENLDGPIQKSLKNRQSNHCDRLELTIFFGLCSDPALGDLARQIFDVFHCPLLRVEFSYAGTWHLERVRSMHINAIATAEHMVLFTDALEAYLGKPWRRPKIRSRLRYDLAILHNPLELQPPSNPGALRKFIRVGKRLGVAVDLIEKKDYPRLAEYDGLLIRETTNVDHYTYRFAKRAQSEGMAVIDDPDSILKCSNKVYLAEMLATHDIPAPLTRILCKGSAESPPAGLDFPVVLKIPDGSFSRGVVKANDVDEYQRCCAALFRESDLILAQEFVFTPFDWRVGIIHGEPLFACQYFMSRRHWQVVKHSGAGHCEEGGFKTWPIEAIPRAVVQVAVTLSRLIGDGLYGVDIKQTDHAVYVIEINDNPNVDAGIEDAVLGDRLYETILRELVRRMELS